MAILLVVKKLEWYYEINVTVLQNLWFKNYCQENALNKGKN